VDRLYPSLELRLNLAASLGRSAFGPPTAQQQKKIKLPKVVLEADNDTSTWAPRPLFKQDESDVEDDIFAMSSNESPAANPDPDEESVYGDALSRKESIVSSTIGSFVFRVNEHDLCV